MLHRLGRISIVMVIAVSNNDNTTKWGDHSSLQTNLYRGIQDGNINPLLVNINSADARTSSIDITGNFMWPERCLITLISVKT
jgi:hypothetical protein